MVAIIILATLVMWGLSYIAGAAVVERGTAGISIRGRRLRQPRFTESSRGRSHVNLPRSVARHGIEWERSGGRRPPDVGSVPYPGR